MTTSIDDVLAQVKPRTETVRVCLRGDLIAAHQRAEHNLRQVPEGLAFDADRVAAAEAVEAVEAEMRDATVEFVFEHVGRARWTQLLAENPPTPEQKAENARRDHNPETFPYAAIAASCVAPAGVTEAKVRDLEEALTSDQWDQLWAATLLANLGGRTPGESVAASAVLRRLRPSSEPASSLASADQNSSAES